MNRIRTIAILAAVLAAGNLTAAQKVLPGDGMDKAQFEAAKAQLIAQMDDERYREITPTDKAAVLAALDRISARLAKAPPMSDKDVVDIYNDQQIVNTITAHAAAESRIYCERSMPTGSHRIHVLCLTIAQWMDRQADGIRAMHSIERNHNNTFPGAE